MQLIVTTSRKASAGTSTEAAEWAQRLGAPFVPRADKSLPELVRESSAEAALGSPSPPVSLARSKGK